MTLKPAVGDHRAAAFAVRAGIHHHDVVAVTQQKLGVAEVAGAIVGDAAEDEDPVAIGVGGADFPTFERGAVGGANFEVFFGGAGAGEHGGSLGGALGVEIHRVENGGADEETGDTGETGEKHESRKGEEREAGFGFPGHCVDALYIKIRAAHGRCCSGVGSCSGGS